MLFMRCFEAFVQVTKKMLDLHVFDCFLSSTGE